MLADMRPFFVIFGRKGVVRLYIRLIFNSNSEAVIGFNIRVRECLKKMIGKGEIVICGIVFVGIKIATYVWDIHEPTAAKHTVNVMQTGKGNARLL